MHMIKNILALAAVTITFIACESKTQKLPIIGERDVVEKVVDGKTVVDTVYAAIPEFQFLKFK